jgi:nucleoside-diphosphate-sugar epimerase
MKVGDKTMKVLLTGGLGNLGQTLVPKLLDKGATPVILDVRAPPSPLNQAAWHGIHEDRGEKDSYDFFDLNVRGTFEVFEAAASAGIGKLIFISTTSVYRPDTRYGSSKILAELIAEDYRKHRLMNVVTLRPRGFIPYWTARCTRNTATGRAGSGRARCTSMMLPPR